MGLSSDAGSIIRFHCCRKGGLGYVGLFNGRLGNDFVRLLVSTCLKFSFAISVAIGNGPY